MRNKLSQMFDPKSDVKNLILLSFGSIVSLFGSFVYSFAISLYVLTVTGSGLSFATNLILSIIPTIILGPVAGVITDRLNRKFILVFSDVLSGVVLLVLYVISLHELHLYWIYAITFILNVFSTFASVSIESSKPNIVHENNLMKINAITRIIFSISFTLGPIIGGMVFAFVNIKTFILINAISFIISSISECFINFRFNEKNSPNKENDHFFIELKEGFSYIISQKKLRGIIVLSILVNFFITLSSTIPVPFIITNVLKLHSTAFGIIEAAFPIGMLIGSIFIGKFISKFHYHKFLILMTMIISSLTILISGPLLFNQTYHPIFYTIFYCVLNIGFGISSSFVDIPIMTFIQQMVPDQLRGRVISTGLTIVKAIVPIAMILSGTLLNIISPYWLPLVGGSTLLSISLYMYFTKEIRSISLRHHTQNAEAP
ncbi:MFS transporter [Bacillus sp. SM2101]|uniref:MFS transporter n=1 Tax=Bacillus sp. SM2101 TaxID=2805366 RepID=UPI001BDF456D|nr:MFS transporter [Bacillus sp. SM2101]